MGYVHNTLRIIIYLSVILISLISGCSKPEKETKTMDNINYQVQVLMDKLTLEDKLNMMDGDKPFWAGFGEMVNGYNLKPSPP